MGMKLRAEFSHLLGRENSVVLSAYNEKRIRCRGFVATARETQCR